MTSYTNFYLHFFYITYVHFIIHQFVPNQVFFLSILLKFLSVFSLHYYSFFHFSAFCWHICKSKFSFFHSVWRSENHRLFCRRKVIVIGSLVDLPRHLKLPEKNLVFFLLMQIFVNILGGVIMNYHLKVN